MAIVHSSHSTPHHCAPVNVRHGTRLVGLSSVRLLRAVSFTCSASVAAVYESVAPCEPTGSFASIGEIAGPLKLGAGEMKGDATSASGSAPAGG